MYLRQRVVVDRQVVGAQAGGEGTVRSRWSSRNPGVIRGLNTGDQSTRQEQNRERSVVTHKTNWHWTNINQLTKSPTNKQTRHTWRGWGQTNR